MRNFLEFLAILGITICIMITHLSLQLHVPVMTLVERFLAGV